MRAIVCIDDGGGMMFNHRRQSRDAQVRSRIRALSEAGVLRLDAYSARQFARELPGNAVVSEDFLSEAGDGDYCFVEDRDLSPYLDRVEELIVFRWNRDYPRDELLPVDLSGWRLVSTEDFAGSSHEQITQEVYSR